MPTPKLDDATLIEALNLAEEYGSPHLAVKAGATTIPRNTLDARVRAAQIRGLKPSFRKEAPRIHTRQRLGEMHMVMPDIQAKAGVPDDHLEWAANYAVEKRPDVIVQIGDWADFESLCSYDKGKLDYEGRRYVKDVDAANRSLDRFERVLERHNRDNPNDRYKPRKVVTFGNHENRVNRAVQIQPELKGKLTLDDLEFARRGWECHDFLEVVKISGIEYSHYFISGSMGRPVSSAAALLRERQCSATMGHVQHADMAMHKQTQYRALFAGCFYAHNESYLGPQGNSYRRQIIIKHEVKDGRYDMMEVSLAFLQKAYS